MIILLGIDLVKYTSEEAVHFRGAGGYLPNGNKKQREKVFGWYNPNGKLTMKTVYSICSSLDRTYNLLTNNCQDFCTNFQKELDRWITGLTQY